MHRVLDYGTVYCTQSGGGRVHIFSKRKSNMYTFVQPMGVSIFSPKTQKCHVYFCTTKGGGGGVGNNLIERFINRCYRIIF